MRGCRRCAAPLGKHNRSGVCRACYSRCFCPACHVWNPGRGKFCPACAEAAALSATWEPVRPPADKLPRLIRRYELRAAFGLPLFGGWA